MNTAQDYLSDTASGSMRGGFNSRLHGESFADCMRHVPAGYYWGQRSFGWSEADNLIRQGKIFSVHRFDYLPFNSLWPEWWVVKVYKDGDAWCCVGEGFEDLQASDNYAFGDSKEDALEKYKALFETGDTARKEL